jgi:hypothetical protein
VEKRNKLELEEEKAWDNFANSSSTSNRLLSSPLSTAAARVHASTPTASESFYFIDFVSIFLLLF